MMTALDAQATPVSDLDPFGDNFLEDPYQAHRDLREAGCAVWLERYRVWAMARHEQVDAALRDPETYCSRRGVGLTDFAREEPWAPEPAARGRPPRPHPCAARDHGGALTTDSRGDARELRI